MNQQYVPGELPCLADEIVARLRRRLDEDAQAQVLRELKSAFPETWVNSRAAVEVRVSENARALWPAIRQGPSRRLLWLPLAGLELRRWARGSELVDLMAITGGLAVFLAVAWWWYPLCLLLLPLVVVYHVLAWQWQGARLRRALAVFDDRQADAVRVLKRDPTFLLAFHDRNVKPLVAQHRADLERRLAAIRADQARLVELRAEVERTLVRESDRASNIRALDEALAGLERRSSEILFLRGAIQRFSRRLDDEMERLKHRRREVDLQAEVVRAIEAAGASTAQSEMAAAQRLQEVEESAQIVVEMLSDASAYMDARAEVDLQGLVGARR